MNSTNGKVAPMQTGEKKFYFGGSPISPQYANFTGCISNAYFTRYAAFLTLICVIHKEGQNNCGNTDIIKSENNDIYLRY